MLKRNPDNAATPDDNGRRTRRRRLADSRVGRWARQRPFVGGVAMIIGGFIVMIFPFLPVKNYVTAGVALGWYDSGTGLKMVHPPLGLAGGLVLVIGGAIVLRRPGTHRFVGVIGVMAGFVSFFLNHLGGFVVGMLLGIVGGALAHSWVPGPRGEHHQRDRRPDDDGGRDDAPTPPDTPSDNGSRQERLVDPEFFSLVKR